MGRYSMGCLVGGAARPRGGGGAGGARERAGAGARRGAGAHDVDHRPRDQDRPHGAGAHGGAGDAATCAGLPWTVLAAVGAVESAHGQSTAPGVRDGANVAGAMGPMQFLAGTWAGYAADGDGDGVGNVYDPDDAVFGAARYLCASGARRVTTLRSALWHYNHADWYVEMVLDLAAKY